MIDGVLEKFFMKMLVFSLYNSGSLKALEQMRFLKILREIFKF